MPMVAVITPKIRLFFRQFIVSVREKMVFHWLKVKFSASKSDLPTSILNEVVRIVAKGISTTMMANRLTRMVNGQRHLPRSTMLGRVDLPDTVMYCLRATTKSDRYRMMMASAIRNTAKPVASLMPCAPRPLYSMMRVVTVCTLPGAPIMDGMP